MYDNVRLMLAEPFREESERTAFISRFALFVQDDKKGIYHNKGYETLSQNKGIYIWLEVGTRLGKGKLILCLSLHKFYNAMRVGHLFNYDYFGFEEANEAGYLLSDFLGIDLSTAIVKKYEIGVNIPTEKPPEEYMKELDYFEIKGRRYRVLEDRKHKEYKLYGTHSDKGRRIVYLFYDKTYEARSKLKDERRRDKVPNNILRVEMDIQRPSEKILFPRLFEPTYQGMLLREFRQRFTGDLHYKERGLAGPVFTEKQLALYRLLCEQGEAGVLEYYRALYQRKSISRAKYRYMVSLLDVVKKKADQVRVCISPESEYLSREIRAILT